MLLYLMESATISRLEVPTFDGSLIDIVSRTTYLALYAAVGKPYATIQDEWMGKTEGAHSEACYSTGWAYILYYDWTDSRGNS